MQIVKCIEFTLASVYILLYTWPTVRRYYYWLIDGIENLITWFPVIWSDRNWDQYYLYVILHKKLKNMSVYFKRHAIAADSDETASRIDTCVNLLDRIIKDDYLFKCFPDLLEWHEKNPLKWEPLDGGGKRCTSSRQSYWDDKPKDSIQIPDKMMEQDLDLLFKLMRKHIRTWWD